MAKPINEDISVVRGDDDDKFVDFSVDVSELDEVWFTVREEWRTESDASDGAVVFQAKMSTGGMQAGSTSKQLRLPLPSAQTTTWWFSQYVYDVQVSAGGKITTTQRGILRVEPDVTASLA